MDRNTRRLHPQLGLRTGVRLLLCLLLMCVTRHPAHAQLSPHAQRTLYAASQDMEKKEFSKAAQALQKYIDTNDGKADEQFYTMLGNCHLETEHTAEAYATYQQGTQQHPSSYALNYNLGVAAYGLEKLAIAATAFETAYALQQADTKQYGDMPELLYQAAACRYQLKDYATALDRLHTLLDRPDIKKSGPKPNWTKLQVHLLCQLKRWKEAQATLTSLLAVHPELAEYWELLAQIQLNRDQHALAASALETAYALKPPKTSKWRALADIYLYLNAPLQAARCLQKANPDDLTHQLSAVYARTNRYNQALAVCEQLIQASPCADNYLLKARLQLDAGHTRQSLQTYLQAANATACPKGQKTRSSKSIRGEAYTMAALAAWDLKDWPGVLRSFEQAQKTEPPYSQQAAYGCALARDIMEAGVEDPERVPTLK